VGHEYLSLAASRHYDGERPPEYLFGLLGQPDDRPRFRVGGSQIDAEVALLLVEWRLPAAKRRHDTAPGRHPGPTVPD